jgi:prolyl-tRNA editing enzyme YbaK/EbsC (Cys-tRNA(Pro) deacylase)
MTRLAKSAVRVQAYLADHGLVDRVRELPDSTRTAQEAAGSINCQVAQIAKSIVFRNTVTGEPVLVVASGVNMVDPRKIEASEKSPLAKADADFIRAQTGFVIGGVPPAGHITPVKTYLDEDLLNFAELWAAAGTPHAVFRLTPQELEAISGGCWLNVRRQ